MQKILVVDDNNAFAAYMSSLLSEFGYEVTTLVQSTLLFQSLCDHPVDLVLLDITMPGIDGISLLKSIKSDSRLKHIEVIMVTATNEDKVIAECLNNGSSDFITKPVTELVLIARVRAAMERIKHLQTQKKLTESVAQYNAIVNSSFDGIISTNENGLITSFNPSAERIFNYSSAEIVGNYVTIFSVEPYEKNNHGYSDIENYRDLDLQDVLGKTIEIQVKRNGGEIFPIELSVSELNYDRKKGFVGIVRDISEKKKTAAELNRVSKYLDAILFNLPVGIAILEGPDFRYFRINQELARLNGLPAEKYLGRTVAEVAPNNDLTIISQLREVHKTGKPILAREMSVELPNNKGFSHLIVWYLPITSENENLTTIVSVVLDVTPLKQAQEQILHSQKMESLGVMAGGIAHEFNNILAIIMGNADLAVNAFPQDNTKHIGEITKASEKAATMIEQVLSFGRPSTGQFTTVNLVDCIKKSIEMIRSLTPVNIEIREEYEYDCPAINGDAAQVYQIVFNICTNAYRAMEQSGGILEISVRKANGNILLQFKDSGVGIDTESHSRIFEPFFTNNTIGQGTGLGLSVVYRIVEAHQGTITIESKLGTGTTFNITLPALVGKTQKITNANTDIKGRAHILVVDDEVSLLTLYKEILESEDYQVTTTENGVQALAAFTKNPALFDLVLTDQKMPQMNGKELAKQLLQIRPELPIIITSGYNQALSSETMTAMGIRCSLQKPVGLKDLVDTVKIHLEKIT
ncbi:MAG: two-component system cell cycle sensor histidine kinase/response regulator CckA [Oceanicoccus sp.]|jgi:two-component system cell cycle sensor histidine kinase/response regulator CckA